MSTRTSPVRSRPGRGNVVALGLVSFCNDTASEMIYWLLPQFVVSVLGAGPVLLGLIESVAESVASFSKLGAGYLADRVGRRKPLVVAGYVLANAIKPLFALAQTWWHVLALRFTDRVGKGVRGAPRDLMITESVEAASRGGAFGLRQAMDSAGAIAGPLLAMLLLPVVAGNLRTVFWLAAIPGLISVLLVIFAVRETRPESEPETPATLARRTTLLASHPASQVSLPRSFYAFVAAVALFSLANFSPMFLVLRAQQLGIAASLAPALGLTFNLVFTLTAYPLGWLSDHLPRRFVIAAGWLVFAMVQLSFARAGPEPSPGHLVWFLFALYGLYWASEPAQRALIADLVAPECRGTAFGLFGLVVSVALLFASLLAGALWQIYGPMVPFYVSSGLSMLAVALLVFL